MAQESLGFVKLEWTCPKCGSRNPGPEKTCLGCGAPQPQDVKFEQAETQVLITGRKRDRPGQGWSRYPLCFLWDAQPCWSGDLFTVRRRSSRGEPARSWKGSWGFSNWA